MFLGGGMVIGEALLSVAIQADVMVGGKELGMTVVRTYREGFRRCIMQIKST